MEQGQTGENGEIMGFKRSQADRCQKQRGGPVPRGRPAQAPSGTRTRDLWLRRPTLYPA